MISQQLKLQKSPRLTLTVSRGCPTTTEAAAPRPPATKSMIMSVDTDAERFGHIVDGLEVWLERGETSAKGRRYEASDVVASSWMEKDTYMMPSPL